MIDHADLARYAGQFVWLQLNFDKAENHAFFAEYGAIGTPTFYIIDPHNRALRASQTGAMSLQELTQFLDRGASGPVREAQTPADLELARGDRLLAQKPEEAVNAYREALHLAPPNCPRRELAQASLAAALQAARLWQQCADTAITEAAEMKRDAMFGRTVVAGMWCAVLGDPAPLSKQAAARLEPLAKEALSLSTTVLDHRDELYRTLMYLCLSHNDKACAAEWGNRWLEELDTRKPTDDEERSALDIARVENIETFGDPKRILPALIASEQAMSANWNASLRVAQMESAARNFNEAVAASDRGLARTPGPVGRTWLLRIKADALRENGQPQAARTVLLQALESAEAIPNPRTRDNNINSLKELLERSGDKDGH